MALVEWWHACVVTPWRICVSCKIPTGGGGGGGGALTPRFDRYVPPQSKKQTTRQQEKPSSSVKMARSPELKLDTLELAFIGIRGYLELNIVTNAHAFPRDGHLACKIWSTMKSLFPKGARSTFVTSEKNVFLCASLYTRLWETQY